MVLLIVLSVDATGEPAPVLSQQDTKEKSRQANLYPTVEPNSELAACQIPNILCQGLPLLWFEQHSIPIPSFLNNVCPPTQNASGIL